MGKIRTMQVRMLRDVLCYRRGQVLPAVSPGQAVEWFRNGTAEPVEAAPGAGLEQARAMPDKSLRRRKGG